MSTSEIAVLTARVAQLQALNRSYLSALRGAEEGYKPYDELVATLQARVRELEARPPPPAAIADTVLGCTRAQFLKGMEIIMRDTGKAFPEAFALWEVHAAECAEERRQEAIANASRDGLRAYMASWIQSGMGAKKAICTCDEWDCPTHDLAYVEGRGFLSKWDHAEELERLEEEREAARRLEEEREKREKQEAARRLEASGWVVRTRPMTWAERVLAGTKS